MIRTRKRRMTKHRPAKLTLGDVHRVPYGDDGYHNAFTDLIHWKGHYYLTFRHADSHAPSTPGVVRILRCEEHSIIQGAWQHVKDIEIKDGDARDPKFVTFLDPDADTPRDLLCVLYGVNFAHVGSGSIAHKRDRDLVTCASFTHDGSAWSRGEQVSRPNYWLWSAIPLHPDEPSLYEHMYPERDDDDPEIAELKRKLKSKQSNPAVYAAAYHWGDKHEPSSIHLFSSQYGYSYTWMNLIWAAKMPTEPVIFQPDAGKMVMMMRLDHSETCMLATADFPYNHWEMHEIGEWFQACSVIEWKGRWLVSGRKLERDFSWDKWGESEHDTDYDWRRGTVSGQTAIYEIDPGHDALHWIMDLPSRGDCAYTGMALSPDSDTLLLSYYSQHQRPDKKWVDTPVPSDIFMAHITMKG